jgi:glycosyltransferase involved in cell wall biosynthesis
MQKNKPVRILHFFGGMNRGGAETMIMNIYRHIDRDKVQFDFAVHTKEQCHYDNEIKDLGGRIIHLPSPAKVGPRVYGRTLMQVLHKYGPFHGVHSHVHYYSGFIVRIAQKAGLALRISHSHNTQDGKTDSIKRRIYRQFMRHLILKHSTRLYGCSRAAGQHLFGPGCGSDSRFKVIPNAIELSKFKLSDKHELRDKLSFPVNEPLIGHVGRFHEQKNHKFLIEIFHALLKKLPDAHLVLVGDGPLKTEIETIIHAKGIDNRVHMLGIRDDVPLIMGALDLFLFPSLYEGLGIVLIEAQAAGIPCVVSDVIPGEVDMKLGLVEFIGLQSDVDYWVKRVIKCLQLERPSFEERVGALQVAGYDVEKMVTDLEGIYGK